MEKLLQDLRYARRALLRSPAFTAAVVLTLTLGIGANVAVWSVVQSVLLKPLPYRQPQRVAMIWSRWKDFPEKTWISTAEYLLYRREVKSFAGVAAFGLTAANLTAGDQPERISAALATPGLFDVLGVSLARGRDFGPNDGREGAEPVVILSDGLWRRRFRADPRLVGRTIEVDRVRSRVVGILSPGAELPLDYGAVRKTEIWTPLPIDPSMADSYPPRGGNHGLYGLARLAPGATFASARAELAGLVDRLEQAGIYPPDWRFEALVVPVEEQVTGRVKPAVLTLLGAVTFLLLIACANVAGLLLARREEREREVALRAALGAGRSDLLRHLFAESLLLALAGGGLGLWLVELTLAPLLRLAPTDVPRLAEVAVDGRVLAISILVTVATAILAGLAPALRSARPDLATTLREGARAGTLTPRRQRLRRLLVVVQVALAVVLVAGAGLMLRSVQRLLAVDPGFDAGGRTGGALTLRLSVSAIDYPEAQDVAAFYRELLTRVRALPGVEAAGAALVLPLTAEMGDWGFEIEGYKPPDDDKPKGDWQVATPGYLEAMGIPVLAGRGFTAADAAEGPFAVVVSETLARTYWRGGDAVGRRIRTSRPGAPWMTIVGIVGDVRHNALAAAPRKLWYRPQEQFTTTSGSSPLRSMSLVVRTAGDPRRLLSGVREAVRSLDPRIPLAEVRTLDEIRDAAVGQPRFTTLLLLLFGALALTLAGVGIYGVTAYGVARRTHEIGVRLALGAVPRRVLGAVVAQALGLTAAGLAAGLLAALALGRLLAGFVYGASGSDPLVLAGAGLALAATALVASWLPAWRASRLNLVEALRAE